LSDKTNKVAMTETMAMGKREERKERKEEEDREEDGT
jgi:hypothetical protein